MSGESDFPDKPTPPPPEPEEEPEPPIPGLEDLITWLKARTPSIQQAKFAERVIRRLEEEVRDPALRYAWEHKKDGATMRDLEVATGINRARITWAIGKHSRSDV